MKNTLSFFSIIGALIFAAVPALARDSSHLVCTGYMESKPGPDNYGFAVQFDEQRASDGENRLEVLSSIWGGNLYQASRLNTKDGFGENGTATMAAKDDAKKVFFKGSYNLVTNSKTGNYQLQLKGQLNIDPTDSSTAEAISTSLNCVDLSN